MVSQGIHFGGIYSRWMELRVSRQIPRVVTFLIFLFLIDNIVSDRPTRVRKLVGQDVRISCQAEHRANGIYWIGPTGVKYRAGRNYRTGQVGGEETASRLLVEKIEYKSRYDLRIYDVVSEYNGTYECHIEYWSLQYGHTVHTYNVTVESITLNRLVIKNTTDDFLIEGIENRRLNIVCEAEFEEPDSIFDQSIPYMNLTRNGVPLDTVTEKTTNGSQHAVFSINYTLIPSRNDHLAVFVCSVYANGTQNVTTTRAVLYVLTAPRMQTLSDVTLTQEGDWFALECSAINSRPPANITWEYPDGEDTKISETVTKVNRTSDEFSVSSGIVILANRRIHSQTVVCKISHAAWETPVTLSKSLDVAFGPDSVFAVGSYSRDNAVFAMTCVTSALNPDVNFKWVAYSEPPQMPTVLDVGVPMQIHTTESGIVWSQTLVLNATTAIEFYTISCEANNLAIRGHGANTSMSTQKSRLSKSSDEVYEVCNTATIVTCICFVVIVILIIIAIIVTKQRQIRGKYEAKRASISHALLKPDTLNENMEKISTVDARYEYDNIFSENNKCDGAYDNTNRHEMPQDEEHLYSTPRETQYEEMGICHATSYVLDAKTASQNNDYVNESYSYE